MSEKYTRFEIATAVLAAAFVLAPLSMAPRQERRPPSVDNPRKTNHESHAPSGTKPSPNEVSANSSAGGTLKLPPAQCYDGESVGECANRAVNVDVRTLYLLLALVSCGQFFLLFQQNRIQRRQAETLPRAERAYVFVEVRPDQPSMTTPAHTGHLDCRIKIKFINGGRTPAIVRAVSADFDTRLRGAPPALSTAPGSNRPIPEGFFIRGHGEFEITIVRTLPQAEISRLDYARDTIYCFGQIEYRDIFGDTHQTGFCWQATSDRDEGLRFVISPDTRLNFFT